MQFHLKVHSIIGGAPGEPGSPGGAVPGGDVGFGGGGTGFGSGFFSGLSTPNTLDALISLIPFFGALNTIGSGFGFSLGNIAKGDPNFSPGVSNAAGSGAQGGGPPQTLLTGPVTAPVTAPRTRSAALPDTKPVEPAVPARKRVGRQETILTRGLLSEGSVSRPTLLGQ